MKNQPEPELRRAIGLPHATAMVVGTIIGASIFVQPAEITGQVPSIQGVFLVWLVSGILTLFGALVCAELASIFTRSGGVYVYLKEAYSPPLGFLWGWAMFWTIHSGIIAAVAVICARYVAFFIPMSDAAIKGIAVMVIVGLSVVNYFGVRIGSTLQALFTLGKVLAILFIIVLALTLGGGLPEHFLKASSSSSSVSLSDFSLALVAGLFAFGGWYMVTYNAEETINPRKTIPRALVMGTIIVTGCYVALNAVYMYVLPLETVASSKRIAADAADVLIGFGGGTFMSALVIFSTIGALTGIILAGPRVYFAMARDGLLFRWVGKIHPKYRTPYRSILIQAMWSSILVGTGTYRVLFTRVIYTEWIFLGLMAIGIILLRRRPGFERDYSVWGYPVVPIVFALSAFGIVANQIITDTAESMFGLSLVLIGLPVYYLWAKIGVRKELAS
jgi:APA family basic amino acid/polyamine antiporter